MNVNKFETSSIEVLLSCMHQNDSSILERTNIQTDAVLINQGNQNSEQLIISKNKLGIDYVTNFISTTERGLSKSRNLALKNAKGSICLICDDDEILYDDYPKRILNAYNEIPDADIIAFQIKNSGKKNLRKTQKIGFIRVLKIASWQITFKLKKIKEKNIYFDETLGSGVSKAGGEENKFLYDCLRSGLKVYYVPVEIGELIEGESQWFHGYTKEYFFDRGIMTKKLMGKFFASIYGIYFLIFKASRYIKDLTFREASSNLFKGIFNS